MTNQDIRELILSEIVKLQKLRNHINDQIKGISYKEDFNFCLKFYTNELKYSIDRVMEENLNYLTAVIRTNADVEISDYQNFVREVADEFTKKFDAYQLKTQNSPIVVPFNVIDEQSTETVK